ncbi:XRE family transcriptional regulator [Acinetobacter nosocomialis]|uniref:helix-turn-helix domain-containing protein n=1 Tax=Acinetobacter nosocomialis TaxID=106654 RepID=UPI00244A2143|nr:XRE family transcriptional regulator [Acinetobacter nosocomialis]MDH2636819.1 XRE family transcriptional regulator [Acinetobacter nosocomialis]
MSEITTFRDSVDKEKLNKMIGENCKRAREWAGYSRAVAMRLIFGYSDEKQLNRIVELEKGTKPISAQTLYKVSLAYKCSIDFIFGISNEIEPDLAASHNGLILDTMRCTALEAVDQLSLAITKTMERLPKFQGAMLHIAAKNLVKEINNHKHDMAFVGLYPDLILSGSDLENQVRAFETMIAKYQRALELNMIEQMEGFEKMNLNIHKDSVEKPLPALLSDEI